MFGYLIDTYDALKDEYQRWRNGPPPPRRPAAPSTPVPSPLALPEPTSAPPATTEQPVKRWSHPFSAQDDQLKQLTQLAQAEAGYYPIGRNGMWHGGVHFDKGTASLCDQSHVRCIADGEVVAYRIPEHTPKTTYFPAEGVTVEAPFASGFVLVRHRLEAPKLEGSPDIPPSLTFFSLYMHLQDWKSYTADTTLQRPAFWPEDSVCRVKKSAPDINKGAPSQKGLNLRLRPSRHGTVTGFLPHEAVVAVSGEGDYRKLESSKGPEKLQNPDGTLGGYVSLKYLKALEGGSYQVKIENGTLIVRAEPNGSSKDLYRLPKDTEVTISGDGEYRKLESVAQYVHAASLEITRKPQADGSVVVLDKPVPIHAGELIGHLGPYQEGKENRSQKKLHLEVFTTDEMPVFLASSRAWAERMPAKDKTWLKITACTPIVTHQDYFSTKKPPALFDSNAATDADFLIPKSLLDGLPEDQKIKVPAKEGSNAFNWYHLKGVLYDRAGISLDGWVREEVGVSPWVNPWAWEGYDIIYNNDTPENGVAYMMDALGLSNEADLDRNRPRAEASDKGALKSRLYDIMDKDRDGKITAKEIRAALRIPASAQSIAQLIIQYESEWYYRKSKWDAIDGVLGHTTSEPILNWLAEKERIKHLAWWDEVAAQGVLPRGAIVYHLHPIGLISFFGRSPIETLIRKLGDIISHGEGGYESYNTGTKDTPDGRVGYSFYSPPAGTVTNKKIDEILATETLPGTNSQRMFATGKYQTVIKTLRSAMRSLNLSGTEKYTEEMQERIFAEFLFKKAGGGRLDAFVRRGEGTADDAQYAASKEWASIAAPAGRVISDGRISDGKLSYYAGAANSANSESTRALREILIEIERFR